MDIGWAAMPQQQNEAYNPQRMSPLTQLRGQGMAVYNARGMGATTETLTLIKGSGYFSTPVDNSATPASVSTTQDVNDLRAVIRAQGGGDSASAGLPIMILPHSGKGEIVELVCDDNGVITSVDAVVSA